MFGRERRRKKDRGRSALDGLSDIGDGCLPDGCSGCSIDLIAVIVIAGAPLLLMR